MMHKIFKKIGVIFISAIFILASFCDVSISSDKKYVLIVAEFGPEGPSAELLKVINKKNDIRLTAVWPLTHEIEENILFLTNEKRLEPVLTIPNEPVLPLIYETRISSPINIVFNQPSDVWDIVARSQENFFEKFSRKGNGLYLKSGIFSIGMIKGIKRVGVNWVNVSNISKGGGKVYIKDDFLLIEDSKEIFANANECWKYIVSSTDTVIPVFFKKDNPLTVDFLLGFNVYLSRDPDLKMVTPSQIIEELKNIIPVAGNDFLIEDRSIWVRNPKLWQELFVLRNLMEDYKNSGQAKIDKLIAMRSEIYGLYGSSLLSNLKKESADGDEAVFLAGIKKINKLLGRQELSKLSSNLQQNTSYYLAPSSFTVTSTIDNLSFINSTSGILKPNISKLSIEVTTETINISIDMGSVAFLPEKYRVDVYIDMNNLRGAGLVRFLFGAEGFMKATDAWEFALRFEGDQAILYRSSRFVPAVIKRFSIENRLSVQIPRKLLRGNPLKWGYQVVYLSNDGQYWKIEDFLCQEEGMRESILSVKQIQLPALRSINSEVIE